MLCVTEISARLFFRRSSRFGLRRTGLRPEPGEQVVAERLCSDECKLLIAVGLHQLLVDRLDDLADRSLDGSHARASIKLRATFRSNHFDHMIRARVDGDSSGDQ